MYVAAMPITEPHARGNNVLQRKRGGDDARGDLVKMDQRCNAVG